MSKEIRTVMESKDYEGDIADPNDCIGHRAFKRACRENLPWYKRMFIHYGWSVYSNDREWSSYDINYKKVDMMFKTKIGDTIIFVKK